jgi:dolichyl-phosphate beta-glucosyltransferase
MLRLPVRDTQCGFKMFRREAAQKIFTLVREPGYLFDLEVLALACRLNFKILEVPVNWKEIPGGHLRLSRLFPGILRQLLRLRRRLNEMSAS